MKFKTLILFMAVVVLAACSKDLLDVTFDADYTVDTPIAVGSSKIANGTWSSKDTIDLASNAEVAKYLDRIKDWNMKGYEIQFKGLTETFKLISGHITIEDLQGHFAEFNLSNLDITEDFKVTIVNDNGQFEQIQDMLKLKSKIIITTNGETDKQNIAFDLASLLKTQVTANPLD